ncbi:MAG: TIGR00180 family glycosyltransferase [Planctomycetota bacterium]
MTHDSLTCVVPTHNRPHFLRRLLHFYRQFPPGFPFLVMDSSHPAAAAENRAVIESVRESIDVDYQHSDKNVTDKCTQGLEQVRSPFVVFCADDDCLFSDTVWRCVEFLKNEPGYATVMGRTAQVNPRLPRWCCRVLKGYSIEHDHPFDRCQKLAENWFTNFYAVYRTTTMLDIFHITTANTNASLNYHLPEMLFSQLSVLRGRVKVLPQMYSLLEKHDSNAGAAMRTGIRPHAEPMYRRFKGCLADQLVQTGADRLEAEQFIDREYGYFRETNLAIRRRPRSTVEVISHLLSGFREKTAGLWNADFNRHRRFVRASDLVGCEQVWHAAVQLMRDFPLGIPSNYSTLDRCA